MPTLALPKSEEVCKLDRNGRRRWALCDSVVVNGRGPDVPREYTIFLLVLAEILFCKPVHMQHWLGYEGVRHFVASVGFHQPFQIHVTESQLSCATD